MAKKTRKPVQFLGIGEFATRTGLTVNTVKSYRLKKMLPEPDALIGDVQGWLPATVDAWVESRPRAGRSSAPASGD